MVSNAHTSTLADIPSHTSRPMQHACSTDANNSACHAVYVESWPSRGFAGNLSRRAVHHSGYAARPAREPCKAPHEPPATSPPPCMCTRFALLFLMCVLKQCAAHGAGLRLALDLVPRDTRRETQLRAMRRVWAPACPAPRQKRGPGGGEGSRPNETPSPCAPRQELQQRRAERAAAQATYAGRLQRCNAKALRRARKNCGPNSLDAQ